VGAADDQSQEWRLEVRPGQGRGVDVAPEVVDAGQRLFPGRGEAFGHSDAHKQTADQAGASCDREPVEVCRRDARFLESEIEELGQPLEVVAGRELRHDPAEVAVQVDLGVDDVRKDFSSVFDDRDGGLVAGSLDSED
jgi:hypothetical protein